MNQTIIVHSLAESISGNENSKVELVADTKTGETEIVVSKTIIQRFCLKEHDTAMQLFNDLNAGGGRRNYTLYDLTK